MASQQRVAIACESAEGLNGNVCGHFGHTPYFLVAELDGATTSSTNLVPTPGHGPGCGMPQFVAQLGVQTVVVGGLGAPAAHKLSSLGVQVIGGISGSVSAALAGLAAGTLQPGDPTCHGHGAGHGCGHTHD